MIAGNAALRRLLYIFAACILIVLAAWLERDTLLRGAGHWWAISDPLEPADAIVVLGGGLDVRPFAAADLYKQGLAPKIVVSNSRLTPVERLQLLPPHAELNRQVLLKLNVPAEAISLFGKSLSNTYDEARALLDWAQATGAKRVIIPMESFSTRRVRWIFNRELGRANAVAEIYGVPPLEFGPDDWWRHETGVVSFQNEILKYAYYRLKY